jgi:hypothetical protein
LGLGQKLNEHGKEQLKSLSLTFRVLDFRVTRRWWNLPTIIYIYIIEGLNISFYVLFLYYSG